MWIKYTLLKHFLKYRGLPLQKKLHRLINRITNVSIKYSNIMWTNQTSRGRTKHNTLDKENEVYKDFFYLITEYNKNIENKILTIEECVILR